MSLSISIGRAAAIAGIVITALMIEGTIPVAADDAWLWSLLALFVVGLFPRRGRLRPWEQQWWWKDEKEED
jgi:nitric oxide reductase large subunit